MKLRQNIATLQSGIPLREEMFEGRRRLVVPVVALVEGVHEGSGGALFYPADEIAKYPGAWNGIPVPVFHPEEYGKNVSANSPEMIEERSVGNLFHTYYDADGSKLKGEIWIDIGKAEKIAPEVLSIIRSGRQLEVSTALWCDEESMLGQWGDEDFIAIARNFRPDHLALLPGGEGACSWSDGCGVRANRPGNKGGDMEINIRDTARTPSFTGTESISWAGVPTTFAAYRDAYYRSKGGRPDDVPTRVQDAPTAMKNWISSKTLLGEGTADNERDLIFFPVVNPKTGKLNEGALRAVISGRGTQARIPAGAKTSAQRKARSLLNQHFGAELEVDEAASEKSKLKMKLVGLVKSIGDHLGLRVQEMSHEDLRNKLQRAVDALDNPGWAHFVKEVFDSDFVYEARGTNPSEIGGAASAIKLYRRGFVVGEKEEVELKDDAKEVREETRYVEVENVRASSSQGDDDKKQKEVIAMGKDELIKDLIACDQTKFVEEDAEWLKTLSEDQLKKLQVEEKPPDTPPPDNKPPEEPAKAPDKPGGEPERKPENQPASNKAVTVDDYIGDAPGEIQGVLRRAVNRDREVKTELIKALVANKRNEFSEEDLKAKDVDELKRLTALAAIEVDFSAQAGGPGGGEPKAKVPKMPSSYQPANK